jgi:beta-lactamase regulating signal transducer with metallopeptidase domain
VTLAGALSAYAALNVAVAAAVVVLITIETLAPRLSSRVLLSMHYGMAMVVIACVVASSLLPAAEFFAPSARVWSSQDYQSLSTAAAPAGAYISLGSGTTNLDAGSVSQVWIAAVLALLAFGSVRVARDCAALRALRANSQCVRRHGRVRIWFNDRIAVPFSYWSPGGAHVVVPSDLVDKPRLVRMAIAHELQHHRQRDTVWLFFFRALTWACLLNPFVHLWTRRLGRMQEFSCDEAIAARRAWTTADYARCLLDVAARDLHGTHYRLAIHFIRFGDPNVLIRRIEKMLQTKTRMLTRSLQVGLMCAMTAIVAVSTFAANGAVQDRRITREQAEGMASRLSGESSFRVVINDQVLHELNRYAGTPQGREFMRSALQRFEGHRSAVVDTLARNGVPSELAAIPLVESGYQNLDSSKSALSAAGIWQFLPKTAMHFGLRVDAGADERLDAARETDAAARMLKADQLRFKDWQLAVLAFNAGAKGVQSAIDAANSRDAWALIRAGHENDVGYLARVHAAVLIAANPDVVAP